MTGGLPPPVVEGIAGRTAGATIAIGMGAGCVVVVTVLGAQATVRGA
ncbi:MAG: hypothetical protein AB7E05_08645 [Sphingobium sp.]